MHLPSPGSHQVAAAFQPPEAGFQQVLVVRAFYFSLPALKCILF